MIFVSLWRNLCASLVNPLRAFAMNFPIREHLVAYSHLIFATLIPSRLNNLIASPARWPKTFPLRQSPRCTRLNSVYSVAKSNPPCNEKSLPIAMGILPPVRRGDRGGQERGGLKKPTLRPTAKNQNSAPLCLCGKKAVPHPNHRRSQPCSQTQAPQNREHLVARLTQAHATLSSTRALTTESLPQTAKQPQKVFPRRRQNGNKPKKAPPSLWDPGWGLQTPRKTDARF